jgi:hypothetical protein
MPRILILDFTKVKHEGLHHNSADMLQSLCQSIPSVILLFALLMLYGKLA